MPHPPEVAELILRGLLPLDMRETVSGDLLEEYRESRVPAVGEFRADLWYWRQVGGMWLRAVLVARRVRGPPPRRSRRVRYVPRALGCVLSRRPADTRARRALARRPRRPRRARDRVRKLAHPAMAGRIGRRARRICDRVVVHGGLGERDVPPVCARAAGQPVLGSGVAVEHAIRRARDIPALDVLGQRRRPVHRRHRPARRLVRIRRHRRPGRRGRLGGGSSRATNHQPRVARARRGGCSL